MQKAADVDLFDLRHGLVKWFGVCLAVASGLAVGPEGPMIFIGASIGFLCSRLPQNPRVWRFLGTPPATVGDDVYTRDYTSIGAACGIAAAFRAPIAGPPEVESSIAAITHEKLFVAPLPMPIRHEYLRLWHGSGLFSEPIHLQMLLGWDPVHRGRGQLALQEGPDG